MKYIVTLTQVALWLIADIFLLLYYFRWNQYLYKPGWNDFLKQRNGIVRKANNAERYKTQYKNKYAAAFS
tara:strand:+ start:3714 stop:3923 length:210 start_codon:yes stop_codon:yes gene_type:complete